MNIKTEYQAMGMFAAWDDDEDPEVMAQGFGKTPEEAINALVAQMVENHGHELDHVETQRDDALRNLSDTQNRLTLAEKELRAARELYASEISALQQRHLCSHGQLLDVSAKYDALMERFSKELEAHADTRRYVLSEQEQGIFRRALLRSATVVCSEAPVLICRDRDGACPTPKACAAGCTYTGEPV